MQPKYLIVSALNNSEFYHHAAVWCDGYCYHMNETGVHCEKYDDFMQGRKLLYMTVATKDPDAIRAYYEANRNRTHNKLFYNCEHFANECAFGLKKSPTVAGYTAATMCALMVAACITYYAKKR